MGGKRIGVAFVHFVYGVYCSAWYEYGGGVALGSKYDEHIIGCFYSSSISKVWHTCYCVENLNAVVC